MPDPDTIDVAEWKDVMQILGVETHEDAILAQVTDTAGKRYRLLLSPQGVIRVEESLDEGDTWNFVGYCVQADSAGDISVGDVATDGMTITKPDPSATTTPLAINDGTDDSFAIGWDGNATLATGKLTIRASAGYIYLIHTTDGTTEDVRYRIGLSSAGVPDMSASTDGGSNYATVFYNALYANRTANRVLATPNGSTGAASFRALVAADLPTVTRAKGGTGVTATQESTVTVNTTNATAGNTNKCWHNGIVASVAYNFSLNSTLANNDTVVVGTVPSAYRPPYDMPCMVYVSAAFTVAVVIAASNGNITVRNTSGSSIATSAVIRIGATYAI